MNTSKNSVSVFQDHCTSENFKLSPILAHIIVMHYDQQEDHLAVQQVGMIFNFFGILKIATFRWILVGILRLK